MNLDPPVPASQMLGLQACPTTPGCKQFYGVTFPNFLPLYHFSSTVQFPKVPIFGSQARKQEFHACGGPSDKLVDKKQQTHYWLRAS